MAERNKKKTYLILIADALAGEPCEAASAPERQGEAIALHPDGRGYTTLSERESATRNDFRLPES